MAKETNNRYSQEELNEFEQLITKKVEYASKELQFIKETLNKTNDSGTDATTGVINTLENSSNTAELESLNQLAARQQKFLKNLQAALVRIKNGTYGVCKDTGRLIPKARLRAVPHTMQTIEAKLKQ